jgi:hypothetical protein
VTNLIADHCGVPGIALVLTAARAFPGPVNRQPRDVHDLDPSVQQHARQHARDAPDDIDADRHPGTVTQRSEPLDEPGERRRRVVDAPAEHRLAVGTIHGLHPMEVLGDVDADRDPLHAPSSRFDDTWHSRSRRCLTERSIAVPNQRCSRARARRETSDGSHGRQHA